MIKAIVQSNGGVKIVVLGVTRENIDRMLDNKPVRLNFSQLGLPPQTVVIIAGETEMDIMEDLRALGAEPFVDE